MAASLVPLLRLLQVTDSAFPVGGYVYSHGVEYLARRGRVVDEVDVAGVLSAYIAQCGGSQWFPAAADVYRAKDTLPMVRADQMLDASLSVAGERDAGRAMGERLLANAANAFPGERTAAFSAAVASGLAPGQYATVFAAVATDAGVDITATLAALGSTMVASITSAAVRLGVIGQDAATRLAANAASDIDTAVTSALARPPRRLYGAFTPGLDLAGLLHPTLEFRMFAS